MFTKNNFVYFYFFWSIVFLAKHYMKRNVLFYLVKFFPWRYLIHCSGVTPLVCTLILKKMVPINTGSKSKDLPFPTGCDFLRTTTTRNKQSSEALLAFIGLEIDKILHVYAFSNSGLRAYGIVRWSVDRNNAFAFAVLLQLLSHMIHY